MENEKQQDFENQIVMILNEIKDKEITDTKALLELENLIKNLLSSEEKEKEKEKEKLKKEKLKNILFYQIEQYFLDDDFVFKFYHKFLVNNDPNVYTNINVLINRKLADKIDQLFKKYFESTEEEKKEKVKKLFYETLNNDNIKNSLKIKIVKTLFKTLSPEQIKKEFLNSDKPENTKKLKNSFYYYLDFLDDKESKESKEFLLLSLECSSNSFFARQFIIQNINSDCMGQIDSNELIPYIKQLYDDFIDDYNKRKNDGMEEKLNLIIKLFKTFIKKKRKEEKDFSDDLIKNILLIPNIFGQLEQNENILDQFIANEKKSIKMIDELYLKNDAENLGLDEKFKDQYVRKLFQVITVSQKDELGEELDEKSLSKLIMELYEENKNKDKGELLRLLLPLLKKFNKDIRESIFTDEQLTEKIVNYQVEGVVLRNNRRIVK